MSANTFFFFFGGGGGGGFFFHGMCVKMGAGTGNGFLF